MDAYTLPSCLDIEESFLGEILLDPNAIQQVSFVPPEALYSRSHQQIYKAALILYNQGKPTDFIEMCRWLDSHGQLDEVGGTTKLLRLLNRTVSSINIDRHAKYIMEDYTRRRLIEAAYDIANLGADKTRDIEFIVERSEATIFSISDSLHHKDLKHNSFVAASAFNKLEQRSPIYPTGIRDLDKQIIGLQPKTLTILAGRPSMGKTNVGLFLALKMLQLHNLPVAFFSLEMTEEQLEHRLWSMISGQSCYRHFGLELIQIKRLREHCAGLRDLSEKETESIVKVLEIASNFPLYICDNRGISVAGIASKCRQLKSRTEKIGLVVVDYLQMMASENGGNRSYELGDVARGLYQLASDLDCPVLALSQISRAAEQRSDKRPMMSDLSQSGILEMVADNIILCYRDEYYNPDTSDRGILELNLAKARHGDTGTVKVLFDKSCGLIESF